MKENFCHSLQHCQGSKPGSSVHSCINSVICCGNNIPCNPLAQVSFPQPTVVQFDLCGTLGNTTAPTADATQTHGTPAPTVDASSFPTYHTPSLAFGSTDVDSLMSRVGNNVKSMDPFSHTPPYAPASRHTTVHTGFPAVSTLPTFCEKPVNPAPISGSAPPPRGPPRGPAWYYQTPIFSGVFACT